MVSHDAAFASTRDLNGTLHQQSSYMCVASEDGHTFGSYPPPLLPGKLKNVSEFCMIEDLHWQSFEL
eukprot:352855-Pelagomonas_calceolata.AAC.4